MEAPVVVVVAILVPEVLLLAVAVAVAAVSDPLETPEIRVIRVVRVPPPHITMNP
jgi:hypothetical protein